MWNLIAKYSNALLDAYANREITWLYCCGTNIVTEVMISMIEDQEPDKEIFEWLNRLCTQHSIKIRR